MTAPTPALVTLDLWGVAPTAVPGALLRMALDRPLLARTPGASFAKLLGTGAGRSFTVGDADPLHWATLVAWRSAEDAAAFERSATVRAWSRLSRERLRVELVPLSSRGRWSGREPFGPSGGAGRAGHHEGPVASITRARIRAGRTLGFWRSVPPVAEDLHRVEGLRCAVGVGEAPVGFQGTFSLWESTAALREFAHRGAAHRDVMVRTPTEGWYSEELFARFAVSSVTGTLGGRTP